MEGNGERRVAGSHRVDDRFIPHHNGALDAPAGPPHRRPMTPGRRENGVRPQRQVASGRGGEIRVVQKRGVVVADLDEFGAPDELLEVGREDTATPEEVAAGIRVDGQRSAGGGERVVQGTELLWVVEREAADGDDISGSESPSHVVVDSQRTVLEGGVEGVPRLSFTAIRDRTPGSQASRRGQQVDSPLIEEVPDDRALLIVADHADEGRRDPENRESDGHVEGGPSGHRGRSDAVHEFVDQDVSDDHYSERHVTRSIRISPEPRGTSTLSTMIGAGSLRSPSRRAKARSAAVRPIR